MTERYHYIKRALRDYWDRMMTSITQQDLEKLLKESEQIAKDWNAYLRFRQNRDVILKEFMPSEGLN